MERTVTENRPDRLLRRAEVEQRCQISRSTLYKMMRARRVSRAAKNRTPRSCQMVTA